MAFLTPKQLSCGIVILNEARELLLCHVTGQSHWDLPKGGIDAHERPIDAALRETREETGLRLDAGTLLDLGRMRYLAGKDLHLFAICMARIDVAQLKCESYFSQRPSGRLLPEMDGFGWFDFERVASLCTPKMSATLGGASGLARLLARLTKPRAAVVMGQPSFAT
ncbi:MAG: NUDIX hydrolase [Burkholderiaceae bacterium]